MSRRFDFSGVASARKRHHPPVQSGEASAALSFRSPEAIHRAARAKDYLLAPGRPDLVDRLTFDPSLRMVFVNRILVRGIQHTEDLVVFLAKKNVMVCDPELVWRCALQTFQFVRRKWCHGVSIYVLRHGSYLPRRGRWVLDWPWRVDTPVPISLVQKSELASLIAMAGFRLPDRWLLPNKPT